MSEGVITSRIVSGCTRDFTSQNPRLDFQALIERLLLFDEYILTSAHLSELRHLVSIVGYGPTRELLESGLLRVCCDQAFIITPPSFVIGSDGKVRPLPPGAFSFALLTVQDEEAYISSCLASLKGAPGLKDSDFERLKNVIAQSLIPRIPGMGEIALAQLADDLPRADGLVLKSVAAALSLQLQASIESNQIELRIERTVEDAFQVQSNLQSDFSLSAEQEHKTLDRAFHAIAHLNLALECMQRFSAVTTFRQNELSFLDARMAFLASSLSANRPVESFRRVVTLTDVPDLGAECMAGTVRLENVVRVAQSEACREFRHWLRRSNEMTDDEIHDAFGGIREKLALLASGKSSQLVRWAVSGILGLVPQGAVLGPAYGLLDTFLIEKILPRPGPIAFLKTHYRSIFDFD